MTKEQKKLTEISLVMGVLVMFLNQQKEKTRGRLMNKLIGLMETMLPLYRKAESVLTESEREECSEQVKQFGIVTGWMDRKVHPVTVFNFLLETMERSEHQYPKKAYELLGDLVDYYERVGNAPMPCFWSGALASERFESAMEGI